MLKRHPARDGAVQLGGEHAFLSNNRPILQANEAMRQRLAQLLFGFPWSWEVRHG